VVLDNRGPVGAGARNIGVVHTHPGSGRHPQPGTTLGREERGHQVPALPERKPTPREFEERIGKKVIGQRPLVRTLSVALANPEEIRVVLVAGPRGHGKTYTLEVAAAESGRIVVFADATQLTQQGYVGDDIEDIFLGAWTAAKGNREKAETAIIVLDEFDKIRKNPAHRGPDVNGAGAQQTLLTAVQGTTYYIGKDRNIPFDTRRILWVFLGAFEGTNP
jgi:ATP-dependent Clp protease ATP-binding subunit ClpX